MIYDGSRLTLRHDNGSTWLSYHAVSGRGEEQLPIACGTYRLDPKDINHLGERASCKNLNQMVWRNDLEGWGFWRVHLQNVSLDPGYDDCPHTNCFIHGGYHGHNGTAGCISIRDTHIDEKGVTLPGLFAGTPGCWAEDNNSQLSQLMKTLRGIGTSIRLSVVNGNANADERKWW